MCNKTKPLDLTKPVQTRSGRPARILCTDRKSPTHPVLALVLDSSFSEVSYDFTLKGTIASVYPTESHLDLVNVPEKKTKKVLLLREKKIPRVVTVRSESTFLTWPAELRMVHEIIAEHTFEWEE